MERCVKGVGAIGQLFSDSSISTTHMGWHNSSSSSSVEWKEIICPQPVRPSSRFYCKPKSLSVHTRPSEMDILDFILNQDDQDCTGYFCGSPPVRSSNPVIRDVSFGKVGSPMLSPLGVHPPRVERGGSPCGPSSFSGSSPQIRIEGFSSANSDSRCVVSALA